MQFIFLYRHLGDSRATLTDAERDQIDTEAEKVMKACSQAILAFKAEGTKPSISQCYAFIVFLYQLSKG